MSDIEKQLSNPTSTGGLGIHFENRVQSSFAVLMLAGGFAPCLPVWPIIKVKFQKKYQGFNTDDLVVLAKQPNSEKCAKLLGQIKHTIRFTKGDDVFAEVIQAAWSDFNNKDVFCEGIDSIAIITGPLNGADTDGVRALLRQARHSETPDDFNKRVELGKFTSDLQREKYEAFKLKILAANKNVAPTDEQVWRFLKSYHLLIYDLDIKGVTLSLLHSLIGQYSPQNEHSLWTQIQDLVERESENAGFITEDSVPQEIRSAFRKPAAESIPENLVKTQTQPGNIDWNNHPNAAELAVANFLGAWNEKNPADMVIVEKLAEGKFPAWTSKIQEILQLPATPIAIKNGIWTVTERKFIWQALGPRVFDHNLDVFGEAVQAVLTERDPEFDLAPEERFAASMQGKVLKHSKYLRKGFAETLVLLGCQSSALGRCSLNKPETIAVLSIREIFKDADWILWGSLNEFLPLLAEAAPGEFLNAVETALAQSPCPFDKLFSQEGSGVSGRNYLTGLLWALETLAWDEQFLVRVAVILGELAEHDPGGNWANRPANSLATIFLPWLPQTTASVEKRKVAVKTLNKEVPKIAWKLLLTLLPNQKQVSMGGHKPQWRNPIPEDFKKEVSQKEYWDQVSFYADLAVEEAKHDIVKLTEIASHLSNLPLPTFKKLLEYLSSKNVLDVPENERQLLWVNLVGFVSEHKRFADADWAMRPDMLLEIERVVTALTPANPINLHHRLFSNHATDLYEENGNWQEQDKRIEQKRQEAIKDILKYGGFNAVLEFAKAAKFPYQVGYSLGYIAEQSIDIVVLPGLLISESETLRQFANGFVWSRYRSQSWQWVDSISKKEWTQKQIAQFFSCLPFVPETWERVAGLLGEFEKEYWTLVPVNPYQADCDLGLAVDKLLKYGKPHSAIRCLHKMQSDKKPLDNARVVNALLSAASSEEAASKMDVYDVVEVIKALQEDPGSNPDDLFRIEWAYLPLLDKHHKTSPKLLENRLASDPDFFCQLIRLMYRSKKTSKADYDPTEREKSLAVNAYRLLSKWETPPGVQPDKSFSGENFNKWLETVKKECLASGHMEVALIHIGGVLVYSPPDPDGLWINRVIAEALNAKDAAKMRDGFDQELFNSRGAHWVDPTGKPELELAEKYKKQADDVENAGYQRLADALRGLARSYEGEAKRVVSEHKPETSE